MFGTVHFPILALRRGTAIPSQPSWPVLREQGQAVICSRTKFESMRKIFVTRAQSRAARVMPGIQARLGLLTLLLTRACG